MIIQKLSCPHCGAAISCDTGGNTSIHCTFCAGTIFVNDEVQRSEHTEISQKTVTVNTRVDKESVKRYVDEAELQKAKNTKTILWISVAGFLLLIALVAAGFWGYNKGSKSISLADHSLDVLFKTAVLGKANAETNLIIMEQEVSVDSTLQRDGLFEWGIFKKNKDITYVGKAVYSINFKYVKETDIVVDSNKKTVTIHLPKPEMYDLIVDPNDFRLGDTTKGWLAFGDIKLTLEEAFYIEREAFQELKAKSTEDKVIQQAIKIAERQATDYFKSTVQSVDPSYKLVIELYG